jgi:hypothetical protein
VVPEDFPVRIRLWVALNVPPDLYQLPVTVSWAPSRCTSVHPIPHLASAKAAVPDDGRAPGGASPGLPHPGGRGRI